MEESKPAAVRKNKNFTCLLAVREYVEDIVKNCFALYDSFKKTMDEDEKKNEQLKFEFRNYNYYHSYADCCKVHAYGIGISNDYEDYQTFVSALNGGLIQGINELKITLNLSFRTGTHEHFVDHNHEFKITFKPEITTIVYEANFDDATMNGFYDKFVAKLDDFPATVTIFARNTNEQ